jgi:gliding motility-associated-like protein
MKDIWPMCEGSVTNIFAPPGFVSYEWSTGATTQFITVNQAGTYWVKVKNQNQCSGTKIVMVVESPLPRISHVNTTDWTNNNNIITVVVEPSELPQHFEYSLDGISYQADPNFYNLSTGPYTVFVRDVYGCGDDDEDVFLLTYPKFFTPNGDNINETWRIQYSIAEPNLKVYIYDRYGKIVSSFGANSNGWDGTFNGKKLPATDYWFVVKRENGQEMRGHFSMIR